MKPVDFEEVQRIDMWWVRLAVLVPAGVLWYGFARQIICGCPFGTRPAPDWVLWLFWLAFGIGLPVLIWSLRLIVTVDANGVRIRYSPLVDRSIPLPTIKSFRSCKYRPIREFGGWGIRWGGPGRRAYNAKGNLGVEIYLVDGKSIMIGTQKPDDLATALRNQGVAETTTG